MVGHRYFFCEIRITLTIYCGLVASAQSNQCPRQRIPDNRHGCAGRSEYSPDALFPPPPRTPTPPPVPHPRMHMCSTKTSISPRIRAVQSYFPIQDPRQTMRTKKTPMMLRGCTARSECTLDAHPSGAYVLNEDFVQPVYHLFLFLLMYVFFYNFF